MRIGIMSDIHSNIIAFREVASYLDNMSCDEYFLLGDFVSDTPYTKETMEYLYDFIGKHTCHVLRGNREEYMLGQRDSLKRGAQKEKWLWNSASGNLLFTYQQLNDKDLDFFETLPVSFVFEKEGYPSITCCHGSPANTREWLQLDSDITKNWLDKIDTDYMICAHTHFPGKLEYGKKQYFNSGCIGVSINDAGFAQCMVIDSETIDGEVVWLPTFIKVPYDNLKVVDDIISTGMLDKAPWYMNSNIQILTSGIDHAGEMVWRANDLAKEAGETDVWPLVKEKYFEEAAAYFGVPDYRKESIRNDLG